MGISPLDFQQNQRARLRSVLIALLALLIYSGFGVQHGCLWATSSVPYYNYLADAFLHGQLSLRLTPPTIHDLVLYKGQLFLYWPPLPAVLLMPFVFFFGVGFSDIVFTLLCAAANVLVVGLLLRQTVRVGLVSLTGLQQDLLVLFFALGTVHLTLAPYGRVWATGQLLGFLCVALAYLAAVSLSGRRAFFWTGLALAAAFLTRNHLLFTGLWPAVYLVRAHLPEGRKRLVGYSLVGLLPVVLAIGLLGIYNLARFGSMWETGLDYHLMAERFVEDYRAYGPFHLHYVPENLYYQYIAYPFLQPDRVFEGGSLFLLSPVFLAAFWGLALGRPRWVAWGLAGTVLLVNIPILLLMGTGWIQFGPRYTLDFTVPLLLLTAMGVRYWPTYVLIGLTTISICHYMLGTQLVGYVYG